MKKSPMRGSSQRAAKEGSTLMRKRRASAWRSVSATSTNCCKTGRTMDRNCRPLGVSAISRRERSIRDVRNEDSSARIWWLIALWVTCSSSAAREKLRKRPIASKARSVCIGGSDAFSI